jgi:glucose/arabinose dehydrogenase
MRKDLLSAAVAAFLLLSGDAFARQNAQGQPSQNQAQQSQQSQQAPPSSAPAPASPASAPVAAQAPSSQSTVVSPPPHEDSLVAAARKAREQKKDQAGAKPPRVFNNDNIPTTGGVSAVGQNPAAADGTDAAAGAPAPAAGISAGADEKAWRKRFADLHKKLEQDQTELDIMQRELGVLDVQNYSDPVKGLQQGYSRSDINEKTDKIETKKKTIEADQQAIADAEDELQKAGGDPGWAR